MDTKIITTSDTGDFSLVERLLTEAFPEDERRPLDAFRHLADHDGRFNVILLSDGAAVWDFDDFRYVEHFAILPEMRCHRYGARALETLLASDRRPVVLEVEMPEDELTTRRVGFYTRCGFAMLPDAYIQPPYRPGGASLPMKIMAWAPDGVRVPSFSHIRLTLHREVYGVTNP